MLILAIQASLNQYGFNPPLSSILAILVSLFGICLIAWLSLYIARRYLVQVIRYLVSQVRPQWSQQLINRKILQQLSYLAPLLIFYYTSPWISSASIAASTSLAQFLHSCSILLMLFVVTLVINRFLSAFGDIFTRSHSTQHHPIKSYIQVAKIILYGLSAILISATLLGQSPLSLLTGLGALTAILLLIFKDSILGFVASVQISTYDMVRIGDWIEIPKYGVDGTVLDISLNTIKIQNFDKTIITIPSHIILNEGVKNWRGMSESGGRRIKRAIYIDMHTIQCCDQEMFIRFAKIPYLADYIHEKMPTLVPPHLTTMTPADSLSKPTHAVTNIEVFRSYLNYYLKQDPNIHQGLTFLVRELQPTSKGLPIELYIFTNDTDWGRYESIQANIFDHILSMIPQFRLRVFQDLTNFHAMDLPTCPSKQDNLADPPASPDA